MKIANYQVDQKAFSEQVKMERSSVTIEIQKQVPQDQLSLSHEVVGLEDLEDEDFLTDEDKRKIELLEAFMYWLTGKKVKFNRFLKKDGQVKEKSKQEEGGGVAIRIHTNHEAYSRDQMSFESQGLVRTEDGREINFKLNLNMSRETYEKNEAMLQIGDFHDPLVLNFDGRGPGFSNQAFEIDLDLDGQLDQLNFLNQGNGFLVLDHNGNGQVDDGSELFGPQTNNGFRELAAYDQDENGWIDENDEVYSQLRIWSIDEAGVKSLVGLKDKDVGAIYLGGVSSPYTLKHGDEDMARISQSSIYLKENGQVKSIHQVDYKL